ARNLPLHPGAASAFTYRWNAERDQLERVDDMVSPRFLPERGQTLGEGLFNVGVTFGYYDVNCSNGCEIGDDPHPVSVSAAAVDYKALADLVYTVGTFNLTYGVTDDLDVNVAIPIATLDMDLDVSPGQPERAHHPRQHAGERRQRGRHPGAREVPRVRDPWSARSRRRGPRAGRP